MARLIGVIPAHLSSTRFPGKVLAEIAGKTMLERVWDAAKRVKWDALVLATPDEELGAFAVARDWPVEMTSRKHKRCMDCVAEAARRLSDNDDDLIVNVQSDEPLVRSYEIEGLINEALEAWATTTVMARPIKDADRADRNAVKLVRSARGRMLYSTREPVGTGLRIAGMFALDGATLREFIDLPESPLERLEACDINRLLDAGRMVQTYVAPRDVPSVDVPADIQRVEKALREGL